MSFSTETAVRAVRSVKQIQGYPRCNDTVEHVIADVNHFFDIYVALSVIGARSTLSVMSIISWTSRLSSMPIRRDLWSQIREF